MDFGFFKFLKLARVGLRVEGLGSRSALMLNLCVNMACIRRLQMAAGVRTKRCVQRPSGYRD